MHSENPTRKDADFLSKLAPDDKQELLRLGTPRRFAKDELVFSAGCANDDVFILRSGRLKIYELSKEGKEFILWFCFPGELFGLAEAMQISPCGLREVNAQSCTPIDLTVIKQCDFQHFLHTRPHVSMLVIDVLCYRLRELGDVVLNLASDDVLSRVLKLIARLSARYGVLQSDVVCIDIALTHQELADMIGASRQTVTSILSDLKRQGIMRIEQRNIFIDDMQWLEQICGKRNFHKLLANSVRDQTPGSELNLPFVHNPKLDAII